MDCGRQFHTSGPATEKARLPNFVLQRGTMTSDLAADRPTGVTGNRCHDVVDVLRTTASECIVHELCDLELYPVINGQ